MEDRLPFNTDILFYWKANRVRYPTLSKMAQDFLAIQPTGKDIEGTFSKGRRCIPYYRKRLMGDSIVDLMIVNSGVSLGIYDK